jgi:hypothetical protein
MDFVNQCMDLSPPTGFIGPLMLGEDELPLQTNNFGPRAALIEKNINRDDFLIVVETFAVICTPTATGLQCHLW